MHELERAAAGALDLAHLTMQDIVRGGQPLTSGPVTATVTDVQEATQRSRHLRVIVTYGGEIGGVVHVRDTLELAAHDPIATLARPVMELDSAMPLHEALALMRRRSEQLAVVRESGTVLGVVTMSDILPRVLPSPAA